MRVIALKMVIPVQGGMNRQNIREEFREILRRCRTFEILKLEDSGARGFACTPWMAACRNGSCLVGLLGRNERTYRRGCEKEFGEIVGWGDRGPGFQVPKTVAERLLQLEDCIGEKRAKELVSEG